MLNPRAHTTLSKCQRIHSQQSAPGFSLVEVLVAVAIAGVMAALSAPLITYGQGDDADAMATQVQSTLRGLRTLAISNTSAYRFRWSTGNAKTLIAEYVDSTNCNATSGWRSAGMFSTSELTLPDGASFTSPSSISICFDSQGFANQDVTLAIRNPTSNRTRSVQVYLGGAVDAY